ncbi:Transposon TX1 uncharacterized 149 kDa protein, partial [Linum perenne]
MKGWEKERRPEDVNIDSTQAWVWMWGLASDMRGTENMRKIAAMFKNLVEYEENEKDTREWKSFVRVRMELFIEKPLPTGFQSPDGRGGYDKVEFAYEGIPDFCYCCGMMGHTISFCDLRMKHVEFFDNNPTKYGSHMRVEGNREWEGNGCRRQKTVTPVGRSGEGREPLDAGEAISGLVERREGNSYIFPPVQNGGEVGFQRGVATLQPFMGQASHLGQGSQMGQRVYQQYWENPFLYNQQGPTFVQDQLRGWPQVMMINEEMRYKVEYIAVHLALLAPHNLQYISTPTLIRILINTNLPHVLEALKHSGCLEQERERGMELMIPQQSDHNPIVLYLDQDRNRTGKRRFYYEAAWQTMEGYEEIVEAAWERGNQTKDNLASCTRLLRNWKNESWGESRQRMAELKSELGDLNERAMSTEVMALIDSKQTELIRLWKIEEDYWASRAGVQWAKFGDRNTRFFHHLSTIQRRGRNSITRLKNELGEWVEEDRGIRNHITSFFHALFQAPREVCDFSAINQMPRVIDDAMNRRLTRTVEDWEIKQAVFQLGPHKSPGPDGFVGSFFQRHWNLVKEDMVREVK